MSVSKSSPARLVLGRRIRPALVLLLGLALPVTACGGGSAGDPSESPTGAQSPTRTSAEGPPTPTAAPSRPTSRPRPSSSPSRTARDAAAECVNRVVAGMTPAQRVGQLFMTAVSTSGISRAESAALRRHRVGSVILVGHSSVGVRHIRAVTDRLRSMAPTVRGAKVGVLAAADQEGGKVQVLKGPGFSDIPSASTQGQWSRSRLERRAAAWGGELRAAGVRLNLAPVADVVPGSVGAENEPIGGLSRQFGDDPTTVALQSSAFVRGLGRAGVLTTVKHFPGLGRVRGNTDFSANVTDSVTSRDDSALAPFRGGIRSGARFAMVSLATYRLIDPAQQAVFSPVVLRGMLRDGLGFDGVAISDDLGNAAAVRAVPPARRATRFLAAGGDMVLTVNPGTVAPMTDAVLSRVRADASFRSGVDASVRRVLAAKQDAGLLPCPG